MRSPLSSSDESIVYPIDLCVDVNVHAAALEDARRVFSEVFVKFANDARAAFDQVEADERWIDSRIGPGDMRDEIGHLAH